MRRTLILCLLILGQTMGNCATTMFPPLQPIGGESIQNYSSNVTSLPDPFATAPVLNETKLNQIEQALFGRSYSAQNIPQRLSRIEKTLFTTTYPNSTQSQRLDNIISNFNQLNKYPNISKNVLSKMEAQVLCQSFPQYSVERRIEKLEQEIFGAAQSGDLDSRYAALKIASKKFNKNNYAAADPYQYGAAPQRGLRGIMSALGNSLTGGSMTGFTPPISPYYNAYNSGFGNGFNNSYGQSQDLYGGGSGIYRGVRTNHGYSDSYQSFGSGTGVTILD